eukprot:1398188-Amphidinium_carterae.1
MSWKALDVWKQRVPPHQAPAFPASLAFACVSWVLLQNEPAVSGVLLLCFVALLRVSEALQLRWRSFRRVPDGWVLILETSKRGFEQKLVVQSPSVVQWLDIYAAFVGAVDSSVFVFPCS